MKKEMYSPLSTVSLFSAVNVSLSSVVFLFRLCVTTTRPLYTEDNSISAICLPLQRLSDFRISSMRTSVLKVGACAVASYSPSDLQVPVFFAVLERGETAGFLFFFSYWWQLYKTPRVSFFIHLYYNPLKTARLKQWASSESLRILLVGTGLWKALKLIKWLQKKKLLKRKIKCTTCYHQMKLKRTNSQDQYSW